MPLTNLKPVFYRVASSLEVQSGWINRATGDICDTDESDPRKVCIVPQAREAFAVGQRIEFKETVPLWDGDCLLGSERGVVAACDETSGEVEVMMEAMHSALEGNTLTLYPFHDEETAASVRLCEVKSVQLIEVERSPSLWWCAAILGVVTPIVTCCAVLGVDSAVMVFGLTVMAVTMVLGLNHALILSVAFPILINFLLVMPTFAFSAPSAGEIFRMAVYLGLSVGLPMLCSKSRQIRQALIEVENEVVPQTSKKEGLN